MASIHSNLIPNLSFNRFQAPPSSYLVGAGIVQPGVTLSNYCRRRRVPCIKCENKDEEHIKHVSVERPPYHIYFDSTSGEVEPASGARASIPSQEYWPEGTASRVRAARAPAPTAESSTSPSYGAKPGSRRKNFKASVPAASSSSSSEPIVEFTGAGSGSSELLVESSEESQDHSSDFVVYQSEPEEEELSEYEFNKRVGLPHPFVDPKAKKPMEGILPNEELWWNWKQPEKEQWSRWQRRKPDVETVFLKAMAETGQIKLHGEEPTLTETALYRARREIYKQERLQAEQDRLERDGPIAYYSEWVKAWKRDTSREAIQKHFEETGEDENAQLIEMFCHQTDREYRVMMGTDYRIQRDPLAMRMREDQIKQIWGGDPVYPTVNYIQDPNEVIDYRGPNFHDPTPNMVAYLKEHGKLISREEFDKNMAEEKTEQVEMTDMDEAMAKAVDIGENDDEEDSDVEEVEEEGEEKLSDYWSVLKSTPELRKSKPKPKKDGPMSLEEAVDDSENLTDFLMDFEEEE
ncbi:protein PLASTID TRANSCRIPTIONALLY ACTIVE 12, chloroplastic [Vigna unguiculata]|uniref:Uncharacterized protein n=1 Tax=Vigna unguiculata TaxID=3917 RepID=A0A4D6KQL2_VIGUN|nr:protein PLASTID TRANSCRIPTIONALLY ACTIVE 12, chloroplastic [Vigna unguiculata]QCD76951.1 hypothetical protein DEO72_LG1g573 [Vigna unguiculata]